MHLCVCPRLGARCDNRHDRGDRNTDTAHITWQYMHEDMERNPGTVWHRAPADVRRAEHVMWSETATLPIVFLKSTATINKEAVLHVSHSVYLVIFRGGKPHYLMCRVFSMMSHSADVSWVWAGVNMLEKSLKRVKQKTESMSTSLCVSPPLLLPHIFFSLLRDDSPQDRCWIGYQGTSGGIAFLWSLDHVTPCITPASRPRQRPALLRKRGLGQILPRLAISVNTETNVEVLCRTLWPAQTYVEEVVCGSENIQCLRTDDASTQNHFFYEGKIFPKSYWIKYNNYEENNYTKKYLKHL